jgi:Ferritin-like
MIDVIKQEMLHLALATNLLTAVGAAERTSV